MDLPFLLRGVVAGFVATFPMLLAEVPAFRRWGRRGVFEWHEIQAVLRGPRRPREVGWGLVYALHLVVGGVSGLLFAVFLSLASIRGPLVVFGFALGILMWLLTLALHGSVTGVRPWRNEMGGGPIAASLVGHLIYGGVLGLLMAWP